VRNPIRRAWRNITYLLFRMQHSLDEIERKLNRIMTQQENLDAFVARIDTAVSGIRQDIADLKNANPAVDFSALEERVAGLESLDAENPGEPGTPAPGTPAP
jgi:predicted  nucleic acid-binding Zn-ribbon protein